MHARIDDDRLVAPEPREAVAARLTGTRVTRARPARQAPARAARRRRHARDPPAHDRQPAVGAGDAPAPAGGARARRRDRGRVHRPAPVRHLAVLEGEPELDEFLSERLGIEPLDAGFDGRALARAFAGRRAAVKALLLDQRLVAGVGNIYADEALWAAKVHPETPAGLVSPREARHARGGAARVLEAGILAQGSTLRDFRTPDGGYGSMQERFQVFDRDGEPCPRCGRPIVKLRVAGAARTSARTASGGGARDRRAPDRPLHGRGAAHRLHRDPAAGRLDRLVRGARPRAGHARDGAARAGGDRRPGRRDPADRRQRVRPGGGGRRDDGAGGGGHRPPDAWPGRCRSCRPR